MVIARIHVSLKTGILDPQGKTIHHALENLGITNIEEVRIGKLIEIKFVDVDVAQAQKLSEEACKKLLANPVIEEYHLELVTTEG